MFSFWGRCFWDLKMMQLWVEDDAWYYQLLSVATPHYKLPTNNNYYDIPYNIPLTSTSKNAELVKNIPIPQGQVTNVVALQHQASHSLPPFQSHTPHGAFIPRGDKQSPCLLTKKIKWIDYQPQLMLIIHHQQEGYLPPWFNGHRRSLEWPQCDLPIRHVDNTSKSGPLHCFFLHHSLTFAGCPADTNSGKLQ